MNKEKSTTEHHGAHSGVRNRTEEYNVGANDLTEKIPGEERSHMTDEERLDEAGWESFPASDPPGHRSKSEVDRESHKAG